MIPGFPVPLPIFVGAAAIDSINPCAFGVLIFLLSYLIEKSKDLGTAAKSKLIMHGSIYILAIFVTYLSAGLILLPIIGSLGQFSVWMYGILGTIVILSGLAEIKDYFWYGKGFSLQLLPGTSQRIKMYASKISDNPFSAFIMGCFVALVELPCTGAVYLAILSMMSLGGLSAINITMLLFYNVIFVAPLVFILAAFVFGVSSNTLESWRQAHKAGMRLVIGLLLLGLGLWMLLSALPFSIIPWDLFPQQG